MTIVKEEIIQKYLKQGKLLTPDALKMISGGNADKITGSTILDMKNEKTDSVKILKNLNYMKKCC